MSKIDGKVAFVTGANRGIGRAFVEELLDAGASKVYASARNPESLTELVEAGQGRVVPVKLDVTDAAAITALASSHSDVSLLVNNAGIAGFAGFIAADDIEAARSEMETNYFGVLNMSRAFAPVLKTNGGGAIINLASVASHANFPVLGSYSASKAAVHSLTQGIRAELAAQGTHVAGVYPGPVDTAMAEGFPMDKTAPNDVAREVLEALEDGAEEIYPDPASKDMFAVFVSDHRALERQAGEMLPE